MSFKSLFLFNRKQQRGIFVLILLIVILLGFWLWMRSRPYTGIQLVDVTQYQSQIDSLKAADVAKKNKIYPFNPNYVTEYRAYTIALNDEQLGRLERFRESGKFINSATQFKQVTGVTQQWLDTISPYFKFPEWVNKPRNSYTSQSYSNKSFGQKVVPKDINTATQDELKAVYGIGPALSGRIIKEREKLGAFIDLKQVRAVYGLTDSTMIQLKKHFYVTAPALFQKLALNAATRDELLSIPYFNDYLVDQLIKQRTLRDGFKSWDKVVLTSRFPEEKLDLIQLYLTLD